ncbi:MAG: sigma-70 family RNA polymerase sigma factor [Planctomycetes bacterium]|nr:sigma-70 family RNA polymerase sigma factor [Planctomycetota bacterium]
MIATLSRHALAAREQWSDPRRRARLLAGQLIAAERRRVERLVRDHLHLLEPAGGAAAHVTGLDKADMIQAAFLGLRRAAETFDPTKGAAFPTHAYWWMKAECQAERFRMRSTIRVPRYPRAPVPKCGSLDLDSDDGSTISASIVDERTDDPAAALHRAELPRAVAAALGSLCERDRLVVAMRFGINGAERPHTFVEIAERIGVCPERVRMIELRARGHLREALAEFAV